MSEVRRFGKPTRGYLSRVVFRQLGARRRDIIVGPRFGVDNAVLRIAPGRVLVATTDPVSFIPGLRAEDSAWLSVNLIASDLTTSGFTPQFGIFDFNLPPQMTDAAFAAYWKAFHTECESLGVAIVGGHTGRYPGCSYSVIGGGVLYSTGPEDGYLTSAMARARDDIILTKGVAVETTAVLATAFPQTVRRAIGPRLFQNARHYLRKVSTVRDALIASSIGIHGNGVTAMHDATEGGVVAAVVEVATASSLGAELDFSDVSISPETDELCRFFQIDPWISLSEGSLIVACRPSKTSRILNKLNSNGIKSEIIGHFTSKGKTVFSTTKRGRGRILYPKVDPYWKVYWKGVEKRWR